jgi:hypothetical protein
MDEPPLVNYPASSHISTPRPTILVLTYHFNIILILILYSNLPLVYFRFHHQNPTCIPRLCHTCATFSRHPVLLDLINRSFGEGAYIIKFIITYFSTASCYILPSCPPPSIPSSAPYSLTLSRQKTHIELQFLDFHARSLATRSGHPRAPGGLHIPFFLFYEKREQL